MAAMMSPIWPPSANPMLSQALPRESAWPGPWEKPRGTIRPKPGNTGPPRRLAQTSTTISPTAPWIMASRGIPMAILRAFPVALAETGVCNPMAMKTMARAW